MNSKQSISSSRVVRRSPRTQNKTSMYKRGAPAGNENAKKSLQWLDKYDLSSAEGIDNFLRELIRATWEGRLGTRACGALNGSVRILLEHLALPGLEKRIKVLEENRDVKAN